MRAGFAPSDRESDFDRHRSGDRAPARLDLSGRGSIAAKGEHFEEPPRARHRGGDALSTLNFRSDARPLIHSLGVDRFAPFACAPHRSPPAVGPLQPARMLPVALRSPNETVARALRSTSSVSTRRRTMNSKSFAALALAGSDSVSCRWSSPAARRSRPANRWKMPRSRARSRRSIVGDTDVKALDISVETEEGIVYLTGRGGGPVPEGRGRTDRQGNGRRPRRRQSPRSRRQDLSEPVLDRCPAMETRR